MLLALVSLALAQAAKPVALVELFTSEGCEGCPPAEAVLAELNHEARTDGAPIVPLALHVTAWDRLGWVDPFGLPAADARQAFYGEALLDGQLFTPMMVINGQVGFVGSDRLRARAEVLRALLEPATAALAVSPWPEPPDALGLELAVESQEAGPLVAQVALVQQAAASAVARGENAGRTLQHVRVVRALEVAPVTDGRARVRLQAPEGLSLTQEVSVVAWVQRAADLRVVGAVEQAVSDLLPTAATGRPLPPEPPRAPRP